MLISAGLNELSSTIEPLATNQPNSTPVHLSHNSVQLVLKASANQCAAIAKLVVKHKDSLAINAIMVGSNTIFIIPRASHNIESSYQSLLNFLKHHHLI